MNRQTHLEHFWDCRAAVGAVEVGHCWDWDELRPVQDWEQDSGPGARVISIPGISMSKKLLPPSLPLADPEIHLAATGK